MALGMQHMESADWDRAVARHDAPPVDALNCRVAMVERDGELLAVAGARWTGARVLAGALRRPAGALRWPCRRGRCLAQAGEASERVLDGVAVDVAEDTPGAVESISIACSPRTKAR